MTAPITVSVWSRADYTHVQASRVALAGAIAPHRKPPRARTAMTAPITVSVWSRADYTHVQASRVALAGAIAPHRKPPGRVRAHGYDSTYYCERVESS